MKKILKVDEIINHMKCKGIKFDVVSEKEAFHFLTEHNYYFKVASYRANYDKIPLGDNVGKYINLDFAYLKELSTIDCHLRYLILKMCLDLEHSIKTILLGDIEKNEIENGYNIVECWDADGKKRKKISWQKNSSYGQALIKKYHPKYPIWVVLELIPLGDLCKMVQKYTELYPKRLSFDHNLLFPIRDLRNAVAHSNCLVHNFRQKHDRFKPSAKISKCVSAINTISQQTRTINLNHKPTHDFITLVYLYPIIVKSEYMRKHIVKDLKNILYRRMLKNKNYFEKNARIRSAFSFIFKAFTPFKNKY